MISTDELMLIKSRLIAAAEAAFQIATSANPVRYDQQTYEMVYVAMVSMREDVGAVLAELDILRGMVQADVFTAFLKEGSGNGGGSEPGADVGGVPATPAGEGGEGEPSQPQGTDGGVPEGRVFRKRTKRSKPRRNKGSDAAAPEPVGSGNGAGQVDSSSHT
jgi:hypothetical protein